MPRDGDRTKGKIVDAAYQLFYQDGFARAGVDAIAEAAGVTKRTLYYHFRSKDDLLGAVLDAQHELALERIERWARRTKGDSERMVEALFEEFEAWAKRPGWKGSGFTRVAMELADAPGHPARAAAKRHKSAVESGLARRFSEAGVTEAAQLARQLMLLLEGCHSLVLIHGSAAYIKAAAFAAQTLLRSQVRRKVKRHLGS